jgi:hypothetical protein
VARRLIFISAAAPSASSAWALPLAPLLPSAALRSDLAGIGLLKHLGTAEAKKVLERLAAGAPGVRVTEEAARALKEVGERK